MEKNTTLPPLIAETNLFLAAQQEYMARRIEATLKRESAKKELHKKRARKRVKEPKGKRQAGA